MFSGYSVLFIIRVAYKENRKANSKEISKCEEKGIRDWGTIKSTVRENLRDYIFSKCENDSNYVVRIVCEEMKQKKS